MELYVALYFYIVAYIGSLYW